MMKIYSKIYNIAHFKEDKLDLIHKTYKKKNQFGLI